MRYSHWILICKYVLGLDGTLSCPITKCKKSIVERLCQFKETMANILWAKYRPRKIRTVFNYGAPLRFFPVPTYSKRGKIPLKCCAGHLAKRCPIVPLISYYASKDQTVSAGDITVSLALFWIAVLWLAECTTLPFVSRQYCLFVRDWSEDILFSCLF